MYPIMNTQLLQQSLLSWMDDVLNILFLNYLTYALRKHSKHQIFGVSTPSPLSFLYEVGEENIEEEFDESY